MILYQKYDFSTILGWREYAKYAFQAKNDLKNTILEVLRLAALGQNSFGPHVGVVQFFSVPPQAGWTPLSYSNAQGFIAKKGCI